MSEIKVEAILAALELMIVTLVLGKDDSALTARNRLKKYLMEIDL